MPDQLESVLVEPLPTSWLIAIVVVSVIGSLAYIFGVRYFQVASFRKHFERRFPELSDVMRKAILQENFSRVWKLAAVYSANSYFTPKISLLGAEARELDDVRVPSPLSIFRYFVTGPSRLMNLLAPAIDNEVAAEVRTSASTLASGLRHSFEERRNLLNPEIMDNLLPRLHALCSDWLKTSPLPGEVRKGLWDAFQTQKQT